MSLDEFKNILIENYNKRQTRQISDDDFNKIINIMF